MSRDSNRFKLQPLSGLGVRWRATFNLDFRKGHQLPDAYLTNLKAVSITKGNEIKVKCELDHVWLDQGAWCEGLLPGDTIYFSAKVVRYKKGNGKRDYKLENPYNVVIAKRGTKEWSEAMKQMEDYMRRKPQVTPRGGIAANN